MPRKPRADRVAADGSRWYTRTQAARFLGVSLAAVKAAQKRGSLAVSSVQGVSVFSRDTLTSWRDSTPRGAIAAAAFRCYARGRSAAQVVADLEILPVTAITLQAAYAECSGGLLVACSPMARATWARVYGVPELTPELVLRAVEICAQTPALRAKLLSHERQSPP